MIELLLFSVINCIVIDCNCVIIDGSVLVSQVSISNVSIDICRIWYCIGLS